MVHTFIREITYFGNYVAMYVCSSSSLSCTYIAIYIYTFVLTKANSTLMNLLTRNITFIKCWGGRRVVPTRLQMLTKQLDDDPENLHFIILLLRATVYEAQENEGHEFGRYNPDHRKLFS